MTTRDEWLQMARDRLTDAEHHFSWEEASSAALSISQVLAAIDYLIEAVRLSERNVMLEAFERMAESEGKA